VHSEILPARFSRWLQFETASLTWKFEVLNESASKIFFQHVMHALMPLKRVSGMKFPCFERAYDEINGKFLAITTPEQATDFLLSQREGTANMLLLQKVKGSKMQLRLEEELTLTVSFPADLFPTLGIWWNHNGYPDEDGRRRDECAFEPIPGNGSSLAGAYREGLCLSANPREAVSWEIKWEIDDGTAKSTPPACDYVAEV